MISLETAVARILAEVPAPTPERVLLAGGAGRCLVSPLRAPVDLPPFDNSAMDGYAVRAADLAQASGAHPVSLRCRARIVAGAAKGETVRAGECARIFTGAPLPPGADAVVMQEEVQAAAEEINFIAAVEVGENVRRQGEDVRVGAVVAECGVTVTPGMLGLLGALGMREVEVGRRPVVGVVATGSELQEAGSPLRPGQIYESNRVMVAALIAAAGGVARSYPLVEDSLEATRAALARAVQECDCVITSGGVSVGEHDFVKAALTDLGGQLDFWRVAMRPGKPFLFGKCNGKLVFGLPGNPVSAYVTFVLLVRPAVRRWLGAAAVGLPTRQGRLKQAVTNSGGRRHFLRASLDHAGEIEVAGLQASHALGSLAAANVLLELGPGETRATGAWVRVLGLD
jgi:molybdopterin molybdotransferase